MVSSSQHEIKHRDGPILTTWILQLPSEGQQKLIPAHTNIKARERVGFGCLQQFMDVNQPVCIIAKSKSGPGACC